jgi:N-acetylmuramoyl-L-alanine amidase
MSFFGKPLTVALGAAVLSGTSLVPFAYALAQDYISTPVPVAAPAMLPQPEPEISAPETAAQDEAPAAPAEPIVDAELICLAKVVVHEAGNQSRTGQLAVAQVVMNRLNDSRGRFGRSICGVVMQRGQFFNVHAYNPPRDRRWRTAIQIAHDARQGISAPVIGNALFFHAASARAFNRTRVGRIEGHVFYR